VYIERSIRIVYIEGCMLFYLGTVIFMGSIVMIRYPSKRKEREGGEGGDLERRLLDLRPISEYYWRG
jgi:hypothetical protein